MSIECRLCRSHRTDEVLRIAQTPIHQNRTGATRAEALDCPRGDIALTLCRACGFVFNALFDPTRLCYSLEYESSQEYSALFQGYLDTIVTDLARRYDLAEKTVVEIGCGQGAFLERLIEATGGDGVGFDPSFDPARSGRHERATYIQADYDPTHLCAAAEIACARHVIEHVARPAELVASLQRTTASYDAVWIETPRLEWIVEHRAFWDIFYEHCSYFTMPVLANLLVGRGWRITTHRAMFADQYQWIEAARGTSAGEPLGGSDEDLHQFGAAWDTWRASWRERLAAWSARGPCAVWGAGAKGVSLLNHLGATSDVVCAVVDVNPNKQGRYVLGTGQPIVAPRALQDLGIETVIVVNSNYLAEIRSTLQQHDCHGRVIALDSLASRVAQNPQPQDV